MTRDALLDAGKVSLDRGTHFLLLMYDDNIGAAQVLTSMGEVSQKDWPRMLHEIARNMTAVQDATVLH